jgi:hypothetical protein
MGLAGLKTISILAILILVIGLLVLSPSVYADTTYWAKSYGGADRDTAFAVEQTSDLGYILVGDTWSGLSGRLDVWILKLSASGSIEWQRTYGGAGDDTAQSVHQTPDGGYIVAGYTASFGDPDYDMWVLKLDSNGGIVWEYAYGADNQELASFVEQTSDGGYILGGRTNSIAGSAPDFWALKLDSSGVAMWDRTYSLDGDRRIEAIHQTSDNGYILAGSTSSGALSVAWVIKTDANGNIVWERTYDPGLGADVEEIQVTSDGGYVLIAEAFTADGDQDFWVLKLKSNGDIDWERTYGGNGEEDAQPIRQTSDGGYIMAGATGSFGAGGDDVWVVKLNQNGDITWERTYGGAGDDEAISIDETSDGGYIVAGETTSFGAGLTDMWVLRIDSSGHISDCLPIGSSNANVVDTHATIVNTQGTVSSISEVRTVTHATISPTSAIINSQCFESRASYGVGGLTEPVSKLAIVAPWLAVIGLVGCIGTVVAVARKREK